MLLGETRHELGGSEYLKVTQRLTAGMPPDVDLKAERALQQLLVASAREELLLSAHDCAEGGLAVTLAECAFGTGGVGLRVDVPAVDAPAAWASVAALFSERHRASSCRWRARSSARLLDRARALGVPAREIGTTGTDRISVSINGQSVIDIGVHEAEAIWDGALEEYFKQRAA